jgi:cysteine desulfuration protein SufE
MNTLNERANDLVSEFEMFDDWMDRYQYVIDLGKELEPLDESFRSDEYRIHGCQSQVWLQPGEAGGTVHFKADSDAQITKGLIAILLRVVNDAPAVEVASANLAFLDRLELKEHLSPTRKNGLDAMIKQIRLYAGALAAQSASSQ